MVKYKFKNLLSIKWRYPPSYNLSKKLKIAYLVAS